MLCPARNVLLITLAWDDAECESPRDFWGVFHAFFITSPDADLIREQAEKLVHLSESTDSWTSGKYGKHLKFVNDETHKILRHVWRQMCDHPKLAVAFNELKTHFANHKCDQCDQNGVYLDFAQACGPKSYHAGAVWQDEPFRTNKYNQRHGKWAKFSDYCRQLSCPREDNSASMPTVHCCTLPQ